MSHRWSFPFFIRERRDLVVGHAASSQNAVWQSFVYLLLWFCDVFLFLLSKHQYCLHLNLQHDHFNGRNVHRASVKLLKRLEWTVFDKCIESPKRQKKKAQNRFIATGSRASCYTFLSFISKWALWNPQRCEKLLLWKRYVLEEIFTLGYANGVFRSGGSEEGFRCLPNADACKIPRLNCKHYNKNSRHFSF